MITMIVESSQIHDVKHLSVLYLLMGTTIMNCNWAKYDFLEI